MTDLNINIPYVIHYILSENEQMNYICELCCHFHWFWDGIA